ncbi:uncharacterized protein N0V89_004976 [Didymosphaeria variabile]|uniref:Zn(2)-C6 fungal-type domain-containing protein n=1 Tax=Didymosphaeria variabile TaxID=1932322 RepID=A0A9W8XKN8_9PLEO|nr:uncharacterized protein N0V89_004976 [Didymosphaeria variabile]KAJ4353249.1 hypothetical protein N0V89_004976 [Didymosphaeria variabile]
MANDGADSDPAARTVTPVPMRNTFSCVTCRRRKVKCNKHHPCNHCIKAGLTCAFPPPRRSWKLATQSHAALVAEVMRLEGVVNSLQSALENQDAGVAEHDNNHHDTNFTDRDAQPRDYQGNRASGSPGPNAGSSEDGEAASQSPPQVALPVPTSKLLPRPSTVTGSASPEYAIDSPSAASVASRKFETVIIDEGRNLYLRGSFWAALSSQTVELFGSDKRPLDSDNDYDDYGDIDDYENCEENGRSLRPEEKTASQGGDMPAHLYNSSIESFGSVASIFPVSFGDSMDSFLPIMRHPCVDTRQKLWKVFRESVDPLIKVLHLPTVEPLLIEWLQQDDTLLAPTVMSSLLISTNSLDHKVTATLARLLILEFKLALFTPVERHAGLSAAERDEFFADAVESLELSNKLLTDRRGVRWTWLFRSFTLWHPLAFAIAELPREPIRKEQSRAWAVVEQAMVSRWKSPHKVRSHQWRSMLSLMQAAKVARARERRRRRESVRTRTFNPSPTFQDPGYDVLWDSGKNRNIDPVDTDNELLMHASPMTSAPPIMNFEQPLQPSGPSGNDPPPMSNDTINSNETCPLSFDNISVVGEMETFPALNYFNPDNEFTNITPTYAPDSSAVLVLDNCQHIIRRHLASTTVKALTMPSGYICLYKESQRSFLFYVVANVGPGGSTRPLAVAYRQGNDVSPSPLTRVENVVNDILSVVKILSEPANRAPIEAERAQATDWYRQRQDADTEPRPAALPDSPQPPFKGWKEKWQPVVQPELPLNDNPAEFPSTSECLVSGLLRGSKSTRPGDVQLQPPSTPFHGDCLEYGMVVIDISNLEHIKYGIVAFPVRYMAQVDYHSAYGGWDPVEDPPPRTEPDVVLVDERPRVPLSILGYLRKYFPFMENDPKVLELEACPLIDDPSALDCEFSENFIHGLS